MATGRSPSLDRSCGDRDDVWLSLPLLLREIHQAKKCAHLLGGGGEEIREKFTAHDDLEVNRKPFI